MGVQDHGVASSEHRQSNDATGQPIGPVGASGSRRVGPGGDDCSRNDHGRRTYPSGLTSPCSIRSFGPTQPGVLGHCRAPCCYNEPMLIKRCAGCSEPGADVCRRCRFALVASSPVTTSSGILAATEFSGLGKELIVGLKYRNRRHLAVHLARQLSRRLDATQIDVITWAPTSRSRVRRRGYDQAELLARALAALWRKPCRRMLFRRHGATQTGQNRANRLIGPEFVTRPIARSHRSRPATRTPRVLVVDDVVTTGSTLLAARAALLAAGARSVVMAAVAATPDASHRSRGYRSALRPSSPASRSTAAMAGAASTSTATPYIPSASAAATLVATSSRNAVRPAVALNLVKASS